MTITLWKKEWGLPNVMYHNVMYHNEMKKKQRYCTLSLRSIILVLLFQKLPSFTLACYLSVLAFLPFMNVVENYLETTVFASFYCIFKYFTTGWNHPGHRFYTLFLHFLSRRLGCLFTLYKFYFENSLEKTNSKQMGYIIKTALFITHLCLQTLKMLNQWW